VPALAATRGVKADFVHDIAELAQGHLHEATAHMIRANLESITGKSFGDKEFWHAIARRKTRVNALTARGERMKVDLFGPEWDFWAATREPIETVRARIGLTA